MIRNQLDIIIAIDKLADQIETEVDELLVARLKEILQTLLTMYNKFVRGDATSYADLNKYNRLSKELNRFDDQLKDDYKTIANIIKKSQQNIYIEQTLMQNYLFQVYQQEDYGFTIPNESNIAAALANPINELTLPQVLEQHRMEITRNIRIEIAQSLLAGEGYSLMAKRIEQRVGFARTKARTVARTEGARARSIADQAVTEEMKQHADITDVWLATLDTRTRHEHRKLDGQKADSEGYFHYQGMRAKGPLMWQTAKMNINCRCVKIKLIDGQLPAVRRGRDYRNVTYQQRLADRIDKYMEDGYTYAKAYQKADEEIQPPNKVTSYITYEEWERKQKGT